MNEQLKIAFEQSKNSNNNKDEKYAAYQTIMAATKEEVDWAYEVWDELVAGLTHKDNHQRSRSAQYLAQLAKSDPEKRMLQDFPQLWAVTYDEKFVTARHTLQSLWQVGLAGEEQRELLMHHWQERFLKGGEEKNITLIRNDILQGMRDLYDASPDDSLKQTALELIETMTDQKYQKKYTKIWKDLIR